MISLHLLVLIYYVGYAAPASCQKHLPCLWKIYVYVFGGDAGILLIKNIQFHIIWTINISVYRMFEKLEHVINNTHKA